MYKWKLKVLLTHFIFIDVEGEEVLQNEPIVIVIDPPTSPKPDSDDGPEVEEIKNPKDNHCGCVMNSNSKLDALREVFDEETCADVLIGYYDAMSKWFYSQNWKEIGLLGVSSDI